ncbi:MAG: DNRLRE domain-containing protein [Vicinamibacterales bacterium]
MRHADVLFNLSTMGRVRITTLASIVLLMFTVSNSGAEPSVPPGYTVELVASGARAVDGATIHGGYVYITDYEARLLLRVPMNAINGSFEVIASGLANPTDVAITPGGRIFVTESASGQIGEITNGFRTTFGTGFDTGTSIEVIDGDLFVTNSSPGTITRTTLTGTTTTIVSGLTYAWGLTTDSAGSVYFFEHGSGRIFRATTNGAAQVQLGTAPAAFALHFSAVEPLRGESLFLSDTVSNVVWRLQAGQMTVFASEFSGRNKVPIIGPTGLVFDPVTGDLYVGDGGNLWRIKPPPGAGGAAGPRSTLYVTAQERAIYSVRGNQVGERAPVTEFAQPIAVTDSIRTMGSYPGLLPQPGREYALNGTPTGTTFAPALGGGCFFDGASDGKHHFAYDFCGGQVFQFDLAWQNPVELFRLPRETRVGISYDPANNSLWFSRLDTGGQFLENRTLAGVLISEFERSPFASCGLAHDPADGTLWMNDCAGTFYQYSKTGALLGQRYYLALDFRGSYATRGGEFSVVERIKDITFEQPSLTDLLTGVDKVVGTVKRETGAPLKGTASATIDTTSSSAYLEENFTPTDELYVSFYLRVNALRSGTPRIVLISNGGTTVGNLTLSSAGRLRLRRDSTNIGAESVALTPGFLYRVGLHQRRGTGSNAILEAFLAPEDAPFGAPFASTAVGTWTTQSSRLRFGNTSSGGVNLTVDDIRLAEGAMPGVVSSSNNVTAHLVGSPTSGAAPLTVNFNSSGSTGNPVSWLWDFQNDGISDSTAANPTVLYTTPGTYSVKLTVSDGTTSDIEVFTNYITVNPPAPTVVATTLLADAVVKSTSPKANDGASNKLRTRLGDGPSDVTYRSFLKFDVTGLTGPVVAATLRLYVTDNSSGGISVFSSDGGWSETGLTWTSAPGLGALLGSSGATLTKNTWVEIPLPPGMFTVNQQYTFVLTGSNSQSAYFSSKEGTHSPQLRLGGVPQQLGLSSISDQVFGSNSVTLDTQTGLEWLDLTKSTNRSFDYVLTQFGLGGEFAGWRLATTDQVTTLFDHAGVRSTPQALGHQSLDPLLFNSNVEAFLSLVGITLSSAQNNGVAGLHLSPRMNGTTAPHSSVNISTNETYSVIEGSFVVRHAPQGHLGHWLVRDRPAP